MPVGCTGPSPAFGGMRLTSWVTCCVVLSRRSSWNPTQSSDHLSGSQGDQNIIRICVGLYDNRHRAFPLDALPRAAAPLDRDLARCDGCTTSDCAPRPAGRFGRVPPASRTALARRVVDGVEGRGRRTAPTRSWGGLRHGRRCDRLLLPAPGERSMISRRNVVLSLAALPLASSRLGGLAQSYPARPVRFVVPFPAGGSTDVGARLIAEHLSRSLHQQFFVENRSGANGTSASMCREERAGRIQHPGFDRCGRQQSVCVQSEFRSVA